MIRGLTIELYSNQHVEKVFFMVKSSITFYLFQYHKNASHDKPILSFCSILKMELHFPDLVKNYSKISAFGSLESVADKKRRVPRRKKQLINNFQLVRYIFNLQNLLFKIVSFSFQLIKQLCNS